MDTHTPHTTDLERGPRRLWRVTDYYGTLLGFLPANCRAQALSNAQRCWIDTYRVTQTDRCP